MYAGDALLKLKLKMNANITITAQIRPRICLYYYIVKLDKRDGVKAIVCNLFPYIAEHMAKLIKLSMDTRAVDKNATQIRLILNSGYDNFICAALIGSVPFWVSPECS